MATFTAAGGQKGMPVEKGCWLIQFLMMAHFQAGEVFELQGQIIKWQNWIKTYVFPLQILACS